MNKQQVIAGLIEQLQLMLTRPAMFIGETTIRGTQTYLSGMHSVLVLIGVVFTSDIRIKAVESRGYESSSSGGVDRMQAAGLSKEQIVQELLLIEIKRLELVAVGLANWGSVGINSYAVGRSAQ